MYKKRQHYKIKCIAGFQTAAVKPRGDVSIGAATMLCLADRVVYNTVVDVLDRKDPLKSTDRMQPISVQPNSTIWRIKLNSRFAWVGRRRRQSIWPAREPVALGWPTTESVGLGWRQLVCSKVKLASFSSSDAFITFRQNWKVLSYHAVWRTCPSVRS